MPHAPKQVRDRGEGAHQRQVLRLEALAAPFLHFLAVVPLFGGRKENGNELVAALADLASHLLEADVVTELHHRFVPGECMEIDGVQEHSVHVEDWRLWALQNPPGRERPIFAYQSA